MHFVLNTDTGILITILTLIVSGSYQTGRWRTRVEMMLDEIKDSVAILTEKQKDHEHEDDARFKDFDSSIDRMKQWIAASNAASKNPVKENQ